MYFQNASGGIIFEEYVDDLFKVSKKIFNSKSKKFIEIQNEVEQITYELTGTDDKKLSLINRNQGKNNFTYGLFYKNSKYWVDKNSKTSGKTNP